MRSRSVEAGGVRWNVVVEGQGPAILLLHGTGSSSESLRDLVDALADRYTLVAPDLPGHAFTATSRGFAPTIPAISAALRALLDALDVEPVAGIGHSAGAALLVHMSVAGRLGAQVIFGLAPALVPFRGAAGVVFPVAAKLLARSRLAPHVIALRAKYTQAVARIVESTGSSLDEESVARYRRLSARPGHVAGVLAMMASWDLEAVWDALPSLPTRLVVLAGESDRAVPAWQPRAIVERAPDARLVTISGAGHLLHEEAPAEVAREIERELSTLRSPRRDVAAVSTREDLR